MPGQQPPQQWPTAGVFVQVLPHRHVLQGWPPRAVQLGPSLGVHAQTLQQLPRAQLGQVQARGRRVLPVVSVCRQVLPMGEAQSEVLHQVLDQRLVPCRHLVLAGELTQGTTPLEPLRVPWHIAVSLAGSQECFDGALQIGRVPCTRGRGARCALGALSRHRLTT